MACDTVILLHGLLCDHAVWARQQEALADAKVFVPALAALPSISAMAQHVLAHAPTERFALAGHSMGGRVALEVVRLAPWRVERLALLDTGIDPIAEGADGTSERQQRLALLQLARDKGMREMGRQWARGMVHPSRLESPLFEEILDMIARQTPEIFASQVAALLARPDARGLLPGILCPTLLLCGRQDSWSPLARHERMHALLPASRLVVVEESGHMTTMEQPAVVSGALRNWLQSKQEHGC